VTIDQIFLLFMTFIFYRCIYTYPTRRSSDLGVDARKQRPQAGCCGCGGGRLAHDRRQLLAADAIADPAFDVAYGRFGPLGIAMRSEEHTSELQSREKLVCRLLLEKIK